MAKLNIKNPAFDAAYYKILNDIAAETAITDITASLGPGEITSRFEREYNCKVVITNSFCTGGHVLFENEYDRTLFLLKFSGAK